MKKTARKASSRSGTKAAPVAAKLASKANDENLALAEVKELIELIAAKQFTEFELERGSFRLRLARGNTAKPAAETVAPLAQAPAASAQKVEAASIVNAAAPAATPAQEESLYFVKSPIVGTFYRSSAPTAEPFVQVGDAVSAGQVLCIVEAMKLMNEIVTDVGGTVAKILVENGQPIEFEQPLFGIKI
jgi:acetyl-CoA carboxylase biotin carboxyl carrier protein